MAEQEVLNANRTEMHGKALVALNNNATFLAIANPTNAQLAQQVTALTRQASGIIRMLIGELGSTSGT